MKIHRVNNFLTQPKSRLPAGKFVGVAIHPSSEVDLVDVSGYRLGVSGLVPLSGFGAEDINAVRRPCSGVYNSATPKDGQLVVGESLVLQLYEQGDALIPPGSRVPVLRSHVFSDALLAAPGCLVMTVPFQGRQQAAISIARSNLGFDFSVYVVGARSGFYELGALNGSGNSGSGTGTPRIFSVSPTKTWWNGGAGAPQVPFDTGTAYTTFYVGGGGDTEETYDALHIFAFGNIGAGNGTVEVVTEVRGEGALI